MVTYHVEFTKDALTGLKALDKHTATMIIGWSEGI